MNTGFPGINLGYLRACLAGPICAEHGGRPPIIFAVGPTGSGKGETPALAASFLADEVTRLTVATDEVEFWRSMGSAAAEGRRFFTIDELLRMDAKKLNVLIEYVLRISSLISWRRLYVGLTRTRFAGLLTFAAGAVPSAFAKSPELRRRTWLARLPAQVPEDWGETCGGETADWRGRSSLNARVANSLLTHTFALCAEHEFRFHDVAAALGLQRPDEGDAAYQEELLRRLYRFARGDEGKRMLHEAPRWKGGRWIDACGQDAQAILREVLPDEDTVDERGITSAIFHLQQNLQLVPWGRVLGIAVPPIVFEMRRHGAQLVMRFRDGNRNQRGGFAVNEDLPPIPDAVVAARTNPASDG
jgi:hypothetical protein